MPVQYIVLLLSRQRNNNTKQKNLIMSLLTVLVERLKDKQIPVSKIHRRTKLTDACVVINDNLHIMIHQNNMFSIVKIDKKGRFHYSDIIRFLPVVVHLISQDFKKK